jgi:hypothetical protein
MQKQLFVFYNTDRNVLLCRACQHAVFSTHLIIHLLDKHSEISITTEKVFALQVINAINDLDVNSIKHAESLKYTLHLKLLSEFVCAHSECAYVELTKSTLKRHCVEHIWLRHEMSRFRTSVAVIIFFLHQSHYFVVASSQSETVVTTESSSSIIHSSLQTLFDQT